MCIIAVQCSLSICLVIDEASSTRQDVHAPAANLTQLKKTTALREKMDVMREKRRINDLLGYASLVFIYLCLCLTMRVMVVPYSVFLGLLELMQSLGNSVHSLLVFFPVDCR